MLHENSLSNQPMPNGSLMRSYEHMDWPGIDFLGEDERCYWIARQCQSVCRQQGKKWMLSELYGCTGWRADMRMYKVIGDWQALLGVNVRCPHLSWYTMEGQSKRDYPASISYQSPYWRDFNAVESYFARFGLMMGEGDAICDTLVINPIESAWGLARIGWSKWIFAKSEDELALLTAVLVQEGVYEAFVAKLVECVRAMKVSNGLEEDCDIGPLINQAAVDSCREKVEDAVAKGARVECGGYRHALGGLFYEPTVLTHVDRSMKVFTEEGFAPIAPM